MQFTPWENPMGPAGFEFIEYAAPDPVAMGKLFENMGFTAIAKHRRSEERRVGKECRSRWSPYH